MAGCGLWFSTSATASLPDEISNAYLSKMRKVSVLLNDSDMVHCKPRNLLSFRASFSDFEGWAKRRVTIVALSNGGLLLSLSREKPTCHWQFAREKASSGIDRGNIAPSGVSLGNLVSMVNFEAGPRIRFSCGCY
jgi:hypothetical protein